MADHTPGPWTLFDDEIVAERTDRHLCTVPLEDGLDPTEWQANVRLIAAAPELLDALKAVLTVDDRNDLLAGNRWLKDALRAAIAKAEAR
jgi:hypothetical protein